jgi:cathepsin L
MTDSSYPYNSGFGNSHFDECTYDAADGVMNTESWYYVTARDTNALKTAIQTGPVSVAIDASANSFQSYSRGVYSDCGTRVDHAVLAVGYGMDGDTPYWVVKNSWSDTWGQDGYVWIAMDSSSSKGTCGIQEYPAQVFATSS